MSPREVLSRYLLFPGKARNDWRRGNGELSLLGMDTLFGLLLIFGRNGADSMPDHGKVVNFNIFA